MSGPPGSSDAIAAAGSAARRSIQGRARSGARPGRGEMAIDKGTRAEILRLYYAEKWKTGTIADQLGVHHSTVDRVLSDAGVPRQERRHRRSKLDPFLPFIRQTLAVYPKLAASRLYEMARERGYPGSQSHFRRLVARERPRPVAEAYLRLKTLPGEQAQVDWAHFGKVRIGRAERRLMGFVIVLSYSRRTFLRFYLDAAMSNFLRGHIEAFEAWQGVPRELWYDNLKSVVAERQGNAIRFNPRFLEFAGYYRFLPKPVAIARGNEKGRVERAIRYIRDSFFAARSWRDIDDLNAQAEAWCNGIAADRPWPEDRSITVREAFERESDSLVALPGDPFPAHDRVEVTIGKTPYTRFDLNDYSVPHTHVRRTLVVVATLDEVRILDGSDVIARHPRSFDKDACIEIPGHIAELVRHKRQARRLRGQDRLFRAAPASERLLDEAARRGDNIGAIVATLLRLLDAYGAAELEAAVGEALERGVPHPNAVRQSLTRRREQRDKPPPIPVDLPNDPRLRDITVRDHDLTGYDGLAGEPEEDSEE